ncbi:MAG TPA: 50S ribosomal protein L6 [Candidatus Altiarchaeales archaeon]|nr:50S ribosomal protein L6 [Candidatus Altiarchaeales archaeon]
MSEEDKHHGEVTLEVPKGVELKVDGHKITVKGAKGEVSRTFTEDFIGYSIDGGKLTLTAHSKRLPLKKQFAIMKTIRSHIKNMFEGVTNGFEYRMKIFYSHFPMKVNVKGSELVIENFLGEHHSRNARILENVKVDVKGADVTITGINKEFVSQTAANIEQATKIKNLDDRIFQDGIYIIEKSGRVL